MQIRVAVLFVGGLLLHPGSSALSAARNNDMSMVSRMEQKESEDDCCEIGTYKPNSKRQRRFSRTDQEVSYDDDHDHCCEIGTYIPNPKRQQRLTERRRVSRMAQNVSDDDCCEIGSSTSTPNPNKQPELTERMKNKKKKQSNFEIGSKSWRDEDDDREQRLQPSVLVIINNNPHQLTGFRKGAGKGCQTELLCFDYN